MPQLDAALAFALTMLAIASLTTTIVAFINSKIQLRRRKLSQMVEQFFTEKALPAAERELRELAEKGAGQALDRIRAELLKMKAERETAGGPNKVPRRFMAAAEASDLLEDIDERELVSLSTEALKDWIRDSPLGKEWRAQMGEDVEKVVDYLGREWESLGNTYTAWFRANAKVMNTLVAAVLAVTFNIDSFYLLNIYLNDDDARQAVLASQSQIMQLAEPRPDGTELSYGEVQQQLRAFQQSGFPIGWDHFPNCPPSSADSRCIKYWQDAAQDFDISKLGYTDRQAIDPLPHLDVALFGRPARGKSSAAQASFGGALAPSSLVAWLCGLALTAFLAGQGSPFWFELVQRLTAMREQMRKRRGGDGTRSADEVPAAPPTPPEPAVTPPAESLAPPAESLTPPTGGPVTDS